MRLSLRLVGTEGETTYPRILILLAKQHEKIIHMYRWFHFGYVGLDEIIGWERNYVDRLHVLLKTLDVSSLI